ncbi:SapC family protein [Stakelama saccharophila]|uniref:SapC family protein n=1 Tax=Stakelama saccharophila TaxID=3075605 RepID=A0ABZ0B9R2_9SPHN|nr:SapC family protein [Stakelama sp. W311]WNO54030.1 SapC family protein [Stakelama sp. W311]
MTETVLLNNVDHADIRVDTSRSARFGDSVNQVEVLPTEFELVQREYPIFFRKDSEDAYQAVALLGFDRDENLFLGEQGWRGDYVPAILARGPFSIGLSRTAGDTEATPEPKIHIDLDDPRVGREEGEPVFLPQGGLSPYLERMSEVLRLIYSGVAMRGAMFEAFAAHDLIEPATVEIEIDDARRYNLSGYHTINKERFAQLDGAALEQLQRAGFLGAAFFALASLGNIHRLIALKNRKHHGQ